MLTFEELAFAPKESLLALLREGRVAEIKRMAPTPSGEGEGGDFNEQVAVVCGVYGGTPYQWLEETPAWSFFLAAAGIAAVRNERLANQTDALVLANPQVKKHDRDAVAKRRQPRKDFEDLRSALRSGLVKETQNPSLISALGIRVEEV